MARSSASGGLTTIVTNDKSWLIDPPSRGELTQCAGELHTRGERQKCEAQLAWREDARAQGRSLFDREMSPIATMTPPWSPRHRKASLDAAKERGRQQRHGQPGQGQLGYCTIVSPSMHRDHRSVDEGQTVVSSMNAVRFSQLRRISRCLGGGHGAGADVARFGWARVPSRLTLPPRFTGKVIQIRKNATTTNNVVTYPIIVEPRILTRCFSGMTRTSPWRRREPRMRLAVTSAAFRFRRRAMKMARLPQLRWMPKSAWAASHQRRVDEERRRQADRIVVEGRYLQ